ncbi:PhnA domain-containing protein [Campylobacter blaseri]|nr:alkylphosphonate utilization protein [Campylobacter blaseri]
MIKNRSNNHCEICGSDKNLDIYFIKNEINFGANLCAECMEAVTNFNIENPAKYECLEIAMWSEIPAVKVLSYQILNTLKNEAFAKDLLDILYIEDELKDLANLPTNDITKTFDSNGSILKQGDSVTLIKDLEVKGAGFTAKRGTLVKNIMLTNNPEQVEGKINGTRIVLLSKFLKKV